MSAPATPAAVVLVGTTLSPDSDRIVGTAARVARTLGARVHLLHAVPYPVELFDDTILSDHVLTDLRERERAALGRDVAAQAERLGIGADLLAGITVDPAEPHRALVRLAKELDPELLVVGAAEEEGRVTRAFGSTAGRVIRKTARPVLVVRGELALPPERVLLPVDLSPLSGEATREAAGLLVRLGVSSRTRCETLYVLTEREERLHAAAEGTAEPTAALARQRLARFTGRYLDTLPGPVDSGVEAGDPADAIVARSATIHPDLVVVGTHGRSGFERLLIGSVADGVVRRVRTSVLVVPVKTT